MAMAFAIADFLQSLYGYSLGPVARRLLRIGLRRVICKKAREQREQQERGMKESSHDGLHLRSRGFLSRSSKRGLAVERLPLGT